MDSGGASLIQVVDEVTGVTSAIVDDEFQDSLSAKGRFMVQQVLIKRTEQQKVVEINL